MSHDITVDQALEAALNATLAVSSELLPETGTAEFSVTIAQMPIALAGTKLRLHIGPVTVMTMQLPPAPRNVPLRYGVTRLPLSKLRNLRDLSVMVSSENGAQPFRFAVSNLSGNLLEALTLATPAAFFNKIQLHHRRYKDPALLTLGAIASYGRFADFDVRAAALTILAHRLLERDFRSFDAEDREAMEWICAEGLRVVEEGATALNGTAAPPWTLVRWTVSLATVCGLLALIQDRLGDARRLFGLAAAQTGHVQISPVSALNLINACLIHGLLLAMDNEMEAARETLERGVTAFPQCSASQDVMRNIWVLGDLINVCRASRTCFIALGRLRLLRPRLEPQMNEVDILDLAQVKSPLQTILQAGLAPRLAALVEEIASRRLDPGIAP